MKLGLALSGGGMRGIAHAGVLKALEENNIKVDVIAGTSSGSLIAVLIAIGCTSTEILELFKKYAYSLVGDNSEIIMLDSFLFNKKIKFDGLRSGKPIEDLYNKICSEKGYTYMRDLKMPIAVVSTDVTSEKECIFSSIIPERTNYIDSIEIGKAVRASSSFSVVFDPCIYNEKILLDGGILNNVPADVAKEMGADKIISIKFSSDKVNENSNLIQIGMKTIDMMSNKISEINLNNSDIVLTVNSDGTSLLDVDNMEYCFNSGYETAMENMNEIKKMLGI